MTENQKIAIYSGALQGAIHSSHMTQEDPVDVALREGDKLIDALTKREQEKQGTLNDHDD